MLQATNQPSSDKRRENKGRCKRRVTVRTGGNLEDRKQVGHQTERVAFATTKEGGDKDANGWEADAI